MSKINLLLFVLLLALIGKGLTYQPLLTVFCTNWSSKCNKLKTEWDIFNATNKAVLAKGGIDLDWIDADLEPSLTQKEGVTSYPTIKFSTESYKVIFDDSKPMTAATLMEFVNESFLKPCTQVTSSAEAKYASNKGTSLYYTGPADESNTTSPFSVFKAAAAIARSEDPSATFFYTEQKSTQPNLVLFNTLGEESHFKQSFDIDEILEFINIFKHGQIINCNNTKLITEMFVRDLGVVFGFFNDTNADQEKEFLEVFRQAARERKDDSIIYAHCDVNDKFARERIMDQFPSADKTPSFGIMEFEDDVPVRYVLDVKKPQDLIDKIDLFSAGKLSPHFLSEPAPEAEELAGPVYKLVGSTYEERVLDPKIYAIVLLYSDNEENCPECASVNFPNKGLK